MDQFPAAKRLELHLEKLGQTLAGDPDIVELLSKRKSPSMQSCLAGDKGNLETSAVLTPFKKKGR